MPLESVLMSEASMSTTISTPELTSREEPGPVTERIPRDDVQHLGGHAWTSRLLALLGSLAIILLAFFLFVRPWYLQWGATDDEARRPLPGDEIVRNAAGQETRAITIEASADRVWPWLAQIGQDRGGFYSYDLLENLVGCEMPTEDYLRPEKQSWQLGSRFAGAARRDGRCSASPSTAPSSSPCTS